MTTRLDRRRFLQATSLAGFGIWVPGAWRGAGRSPNERLSFACIGVGGKGASDTDHAGELGDIVALCDIDEERLGKKAEKFPEAKTYSDFRKLLEELAPKIDAVVVSTPDHTHAAAAVMAMRMGKHVYCQKPLTHSAWEARLMRETAAERKVATQMGNQGTAHPGFRDGRRADPLRASSGRSARSTSGRTGRSSTGSRPPTSSPGPRRRRRSRRTSTGTCSSARRPSGRTTRSTTRTTGAAGGTSAPARWATWPATRPTSPFMALKLGLPTRVSAESGEINPETYPAWATITYEFPARGDLPPVKLTWYEGARDGKRHLPAGRAVPGRDAVRQRLAARRREGLDLLAERLRRGAGAAARRAGSRGSSPAATAERAQAAGPHDRRGPQGRVGPRDPRGRARDRLVELRLRRRR